MQLTDPHQEHEPPGLPEVAEDEVAGPHGYACRRCSHLQLLHAPCEQCGNFFLRPATFSHAELLAATDRLLDRLRAA